MKLSIVLSILAVTLISGCVKSGYMISKQEVSGFETLGSSWALEDECNYGNASVAYVDVSCQKGLQCEVYVNNKKSNYGNNGLQTCADQLVAAEIELDYKPDFISAQSEDKYYYTNREENKFILVCCSNIDPSTQKLDRDNETCQSTTLKAQCREQTAEGFDKIKVLAWSLSHDGLLSLNVENDAGEPVVIDKIYLSGQTFLNANRFLLNGGNSTINLTRGPTGSIGSGYGIGVTIEYVVLSSDLYYNSTGVIYGTYS